MQFPSDFNSEVTYQNTNYTNPHDEGVTWTNDGFKDLFMNRLFIPNYIWYASNKKMAKDKIVMYVEILMQNEDFLNLGIFYCRCKSILMMFETNASFIEDYRKHLHSKKNIILKRNFLNAQCIDYILHGLPSQLDLSVAFEYARIIAQNLMIHIIHATIKKKEYTDPANDERFLHLVKKYNKAYCTSKLPMMMWEIWAVGFLVNFGASCCRTSELFVVSQELLANELKLPI